MIQPKYSPEEALQRVKLMMKYDTSKTLNENIIISEQIDISSDIRDIKDEISSFNSDEGEIIKIIQKYNSAADFNKLIDAWKEKYSTDFGGALYSAINSNDPTESKQLQDHLKSFGITATAKSTGDKRGTFMWDFGQGIKNDGKKKTDDGKKDKTNEKTSSYTPCKPGQYIINCKSDVVKQIQGCLGMPVKYQTGNFGPITQGNLQKLGKGFENGFTDKDVDTICNKQPVKPAGVEDLEDETTANTQKPF